VRLTLFVIILLSAAAANAMQTRNDIDRKVDHINDSVDYYWHTNTARALVLVDEAYMLLDYLTDPTTISQVIANKGISAYTLGDFEAARKFYLRAIKYAQLNEVPTTEFYLYILGLLQREGQSNKIINLSDSLINVGWTDAHLMRTKANALIDLQRIEEFDEILDQVNGRNDSRWFASIAEKFRILNQYDSAFYYLDRLSEITPVSELIQHADIKNRKSKIFQMTGQFDNVLIELDSALRIYEMSNFLYGKAEVLYGMGNLYSQLGNFEKSIDYYYQSREIFEQLKSQKNIAKSYLELGWMHFDVDAAKSEELIKKAIAISLEIDDQAVLGRAYNYLGAYFDHVNNNDSAIYCYQNSIKIKLSLQDKRGASVAKFNLAGIYEKQGKLEMALRIYKETQNTDPNDRVGIAIGNYTIGHLFVSLKKYDSARIYFYKSKTVFREIKDSPYRAELLLNLSQYHEQVNNADSALYYYKLHSTLKITLAEAERNSRMSEMEVRFDLDQKNQRIRLLNLENENKKHQIEIGEKTINNQQFLIILITVIVLSLFIIGVVMVYLYRNKAKANTILATLMKELQEKTEEITAQSEELQEANEEIRALNDGLEQTVDLRTKELKEAHQDLDTFFYRAAHDFRSPLTTFQGLTAVAHHTVKDKEALDLFRRMEDTFQRFALMINKLRDISTINVEEVAFQDVYLNKLMTKIDVDNHPLFTKYGIDFDYSSDVEKIHTNERIINIILDNIIENAIVFMGEKSPKKISISAHDMEGVYEIKIADTGIGIPEDIVERVFELYFRGSVLSKGNGLGLYICKKGVEKINASIDFESKTGVGTTFYVRIMKD
jgi:signal transduction histidine kinase